MSETLSEMTPREDFISEKVVEFYRLRQPKAIHLRLFFIPFFISILVPKLELKLVTHYTEVRCAVHGTRSRNWESIKSEGISKMERKHIHFAQGERGVKSGFPPYCDMAIEVDVKKAMNDGIKFYISENDVVLTEGRNGHILPKYFKKAYKINSREELPF